MFFHTFIITLIKVLWYNKVSRKICNLSFAKMLIVNQSAGIFDQHYLN